MRTPTANLLCLTIVSFASAVVVLAKDPVTRPAALSASFDEASMKAEGKFRDAITSAKATREEPISKARSRRSDRPS